MSKLSLRDLSLLAALVENRRIGPVAATFRISSSAVSYAIDRLRDALGDELLVRTSHGFQPTQTGVKYAAQAREFLAQMDSVAQPNLFDPMRDAYCFDLLATEYELDGFLGSFINRIARSTSQVRFVIEQASMDFRIERLFDEVDLAFAPIRIERSGIDQEHLFADPYVTFYDAKSVDRPGTLSDFSARSHGVMDPQGKGRSNIDLLLESQGLERDVKIVAPSFHALAQLMRGGNLISTLPRHLSSGAMAGFAHAPAPLDIPDLNIYASFARNRRGNPAFEWLMREVRTEVSKAEK